MSLTAYFKKLSDEAVAPVKDTVGFKLFSAETVVIPAHSIQRIKTGYGIRLNQSDYFFRICGSATSMGCCEMMVCEDILPYDYGYEVEVVMHNFKPRAMKVPVGTHLAHLIILQEIQPSVRHVENLPPVEAHQFPPNQWQALEEGLLDWPEEGYFAWRQWQPQPLPSDPLVTHLPGCTLDGCIQLL